MKVLAIQLKRIGDLVLTTPALEELKARGGRVTLIVDGACASLLPAIKCIDQGLAYSRHSSNRALWGCLRKQAWDVCLDFTGSDRSALLGWVSRAPRRVTFQWVRKHFFRRLAYHEFIDSPVRLAHTCEHYGHLLRSLGSNDKCGVASSLGLPSGARETGALMLNSAGVHGEYVLVHPGTARPEKYWLPERWTEVIRRLREAGHSVVMTCGPDAFEKTHVAAIATASAGATGAPAIIYPPDLPSLAAIVEQARLVLSCDTAVVHLAAAFRRPQVALFGPTNPFHWRPMHERAVVISAAQPDEPLRSFRPKMRGASMHEIPVATVLRSAEALLSEPL